MYKKSIYHSTSDRLPYYSIILITRASYMADCHVVAASQHSTSNAILLTQSAPTIYLPNSGKGRY